ncbi:MAG: hypothetical protein JWM14_2158 [Chitinophagaceae bacterium]|nr:hypothetical protein [Chitinophagaceae bacterium]
MKNTLKSIAAILAGMILIIVLSIATDQLMIAAGVYPSMEQQQQLQANPWWMLLIALVYRNIYAVAGGYLTASLAPSNPLRLVVILGIIGIIANIAGGIAMMDKGSSWYPIALTVCALPCTWWGGKLKVS